VPEKPEKLLQYESKGPKVTILEAPDAGVKRYHQDICGGERQQSLKKLVDMEGYAQSKSVEHMLGALANACKNDDMKLSIWNFETIVWEIFSSLEEEARLMGHTLDEFLDQGTPISQALKPFRPSYMDAQAALQDSAQICRQYSKESLLQVEKPKGDHPLLVQAWDAHTLRQKCAEECLCLPYGTAQYCSGTPECAGAAKSMALVAIGLTSGAHAYKDGPGSLKGVWGDKGTQDSIFKLLDKVHSSVHEHHQQEQSLIQTDEQWSRPPKRRGGASNAALCARVTLLQSMMSWACHVGCNGYAGAEEISAGCDIPVHKYLAINIEIHLTPAMLSITVNAVVPGLSDVLGEIQKIPAMNDLMSAIGMNNGGLLLGKGWIDWVKGFGSLSIEKKYDLVAVRAVASFHTFLRFSTTLPTGGLEPSMAGACKMARTRPNGFLGMKPGDASYKRQCTNPRIPINCGLCEVDGLEDYCSQCRTNPVSFSSFDITLKCQHIEPNYGWPPYKYNTFEYVKALNVGFKY
jgi:hypothetical protein